MSEEHGGPRDGPAFYCVSSPEYFLGAVAMINSLRLQGHREPVYVLDLGLGPRRRELIAAEATVLDPPERLEPWLSKMVAPLECPHETMILIDVDIVVTRPLGELIGRAAGGRVVAFRDNLDRWEPRWGPLLGLGELERRPYLCSGFVAAGAEPGLDLFGLVADRQRRVEFERTYFAADEPGYELRFLDQDVLNAVIAGRVEAARVDALELALGPMPPFAGLRVTDEAALRCAYGDGREPWLVHHFGSKPWADRLHHGVYSQLMRRALIDPRAPIRVPRRMLPARLRTGPRAYLERKLVNSRHRLRWHVTDPLRARLGAGGGRA